MYHSQLFHQYLLLDLLLLLIFLTQAITFPIIHSTPFFTLPLGVKQLLDQLACLLCSACFLLGPGYLYGVHFTFCSDVETAYSGFQLVGPLSSHLKHIFQCCAINNKKQQLDLHLFLFCFCLFLNFCRIQVRKKIILYWEATCGTPIALVNPGLIVCIYT